MKQSVRKKMSITKLTLARIKYIREHYYQFAAHQVGKRHDILNSSSMNKDTTIIEAGVEVFFKAICNAVELSPEEADKIAIAEYANEKPDYDKYVDKLAGFVELEYSAKESRSITLEDRQKAVEEYRKKQNKKEQEISDEWGED